MKNGESIFRRDRKGIVDVQFNWIFIMVAGFTIFLFIVSIAFSQKHSADKRASILAVNQIVTLLKDKQQASEVYSEISFPETDVKFRCDKLSDTEGIFDLQLSDSDPEPMANEIIFAPQELTTSKLIVWTKAFKMGFPVGTFTYVTTPDSAIIIYATTPNTFATQLNRSFPDNITRIMTDDTGVYDGYKRVKIICFKDPISGNADCPADNMDYIMITPGNSAGSQLFDYGNVTYHKKSGSNSQPYAYLTEAGLFGAISSDNGRFYDCQMARAMRQLEIKRSLMEYRVVMIQDSMQSGNCRDIINVTLDYEILPSRNPVLNYDNVTFLGQVGSRLDIQNNKLVIGSCPTIY